jgi:tetratricopeptide (TPR) repeat protein
MELFIANGKDPLPIKRVYNQCIKKNQNVAQYKKKRRWISRHVGIYQTWKKPKTSLSLGLKSFIIIGENKRKKYEAFIYKKKSCTQKIIPNGQICVPTEENSDDDDNTLIVQGEFYHTASPKHRNFLKALEYYQKVPQGAQRSYALRGIGLLYEHGDGVEQDYQKALAYYQDAAKKHNKAAYYSIALLYYYGYGVSKDYTTSFEWFETVIAEELELGATHVCVANGKPDQDVEKSKIYSLEPESFIYGEVHFYLGTMFKNGQGTVKNKKK